MKISLLLSFLTLFFITSCNHDGVSYAEKRKLENAKETWKQIKTPDYSFNFQRGCFCPYIPEVTIEVFADTIHALIDPETGEDATIETENGEEKLLVVYPGFFLTIDELFEELTEVSSEAHEMDGTYDKERGFPTKVFIDRYKNAIDDEVSYLLGNYQVLTLTKN